MPLVPQVVTATPPHRTEPIGVCAYAGRLAHGAPEYSVRSQQRAKKYYSISKHPVPNPTRIYGVITARRRGYSVNYSDLLPDGTALSGLGEKNGNYVGPGQDDPLRTHSR